MTLIVVATSAIIGQQPAVQQPTPAFRSGVDLVLVDVVVRDRTGSVVKGLTADDFELLEDGVRQQIRTFAFEEITTTAPAVGEGGTTLSAASLKPAAHGGERLARRTARNGRRRRGEAAHVGRCRWTSSADAAL